MLYLYPELEVRIRPAGTPRSFSQGVTSADSESVPKDNRVASKKHAGKTAVLDTIPLRSNVLSPKPVKCLKPAFFDVRRPISRPRTGLR